MNGQFPRAGTGYEHDMNRKMACNLNRRVLARMLLLSTLTDWLALSEFSEYKTSS